MRADPRFVNAYWKQVPGAVASDKGVNWGFPCDAKLPDFTIQMADGLAVMPGKFMNAGILSDAAPAPRKAFSSFCNPNFLVLFF